MATSYVRELECAIAFEVYRKDNFNNIDECLNNRRHNNQHGRASASQQQRRRRRRNYRPSMNEDTSKTLSHLLFYLNYPWLMTRNYNIQAVVVAVTVQSANIVRHVHRSFQLIKRTITRSNRQHRCLLRRHRQWWAVHQVEVNQRWIVLSNRLIKILFGHITLPWTCEGSQNKE